MTQLQEEEAGEDAARIPSCRWWSKGSSFRSKGKRDEDDIGPSRRPLKDTLVSFYGQDVQAATTIYEQ